MDIKNIFRRLALALGLVVIFILLPLITGYLIKIIGHPAFITAGKDKFQIWINGLGVICFLYVICFSVWALFRWVITGKI